MTALATTTDLAALVGSVDNEIDRANALIQHASNLIEAEVGRTFTADAIPPIVSTICAKVAARAWNVTDGLQMEMAGPFQAQFREPGLYLRADEKQILAQFKSGGRSGLVSVRTRITPEILAELDDDYFDDECGTFLT